MGEPSQTDLVARLEVMEARLEACEDREQIRELFNRYNFGADTGDAKTYAETFAEDGVFDTGRGEVTGRETFFNMIEDPAGGHKTAIESKGSLHTIGSVTIGLDGDRAWAEGPSMVWVREDKSYRVFVAAYNHWDLVKQNGRWFVARRTAKGVAPNKAKAVLTAYRVDS